MKVKSGLIVGLLCVGGAALVVIFVLQGVRTAKDSFVTAPTMKVRFSVLGQGKKEIREVELSDSKKIGELGNAIFETANIGVLVNSWGPEEQLGTALWMHFEGFSNEIQIVDVLVLGLDRVVVNDKWEWRTDTEKIRERVLHILSARDLGDTARECQSLLTSASTRGIRKRGRARRVRASRVRCGDSSLLRSTYASAGLISEILRR
jgi:hypothetical protein